MSNQTEYVNNLNAITSQINYYGLWVILPTSILGNLISFYIYTRPSLNKKTNAGFLYRWLCILNIITIVYYCFISRSNNIFKYTVGLPCGADNYIRRTFLNSITWMQVVICLDRFIVVFFPTKTVLMSKKIVQYGIMLAFLALILITNMTNLMTYPVTNARNVTSCFMTSDISITTTLIANLMRVFIPFGFMLTLNLLVIWGLKKSKIRVGVASVLQIAAQNKNSSHQLTSKEFKFTISTLVIDFVFLFFYLPLGVNFAILTYNQFSATLTSDAFGNANYNFFSNIAQLLALAHTSALFIVFIIFNQYFRTDLIFVFRLNKFFSTPTAQLESSVNLTRMQNT